MRVIPDQSADDLFLERVKRTAAGLPRSDGSPVSDLDRYLSQSALIARAVRDRDGMSLLGLANGLHTEAHFDNRRIHILGGMAYKAADHFYGALASDIVSGRLVVREPLCFLRCNDLPEIQCLPGMAQMDAVAVMARFAVKKSDAVAWLEAQGLPLPEWLCPSVRRQEDREKWSSSFPAKKARLRQQVDVIQGEIEAKGWQPLALPSGYKVELGNICRADYPELFADSSFDTASDALKKKGLIRYFDHESVSRQRRRDG